MPCWSASLGRQCPQRCRWRHLGRCYGVARCRYRLGWRSNQPTPQTDADRDRVIEGLASGDRKAAQILDNTVQQLAKRWFGLRDMHAGPTAVLLQPRSSAPRAVRASAQPWCRALHSSASVHLQNVVAHIKRFRDVGRQFIEIRRDPQSSFQGPRAALFSTLCDRNEPYHGFSGAPYDHLFSGKCALYERRQLSFGFADGVDLHSANLADQTRGFSELALLVLAEVYGFLPPHPHNPPTKRPGGVEGGARLVAHQRGTL
jgi:hypothetical protein